MDVDRLLEKQRELMGKVPHDVRIDMAQRMVVSRDLIRSLLVYLNSLGHKPWRPNPMEPQVTFDNMCAMLKNFTTLLSMHDMEVSDMLTDSLQSRRCVSMFGIIEEAIEYADSTIDTKKTSADQLEELTDGLFFQLEQIAMSGFSLGEIETEYDRKHAVNLKRYADAKKGDFSWDDRGKADGL